MALADTIAEKRQHLEQVIYRLQDLQAGFLTQAVLQLDIWIEELAKEIFVGHVEISEALSDPQLRDLKHQLYHLRGASPELIEATFRDKRFWWHLEPQRDPADVGLINLYTQQGSRLGPKRFHEGFETILAQQLMQIFEPLGYPLSTSTTWVQEGTPRYRGTLLWPQDLLLLLADYDTLFQTEVKRIFRELAPLELQWRKQQLEQRWDQMAAVEGDEEQSAASPTEPDSVSPNSTPDLAEITPV